MFVVEYLLIVNMLIDICRVISIKFNDYHGLFTIIAS